MKNYIRTFVLLLTLLFICTNSFAQVNQNENKTNTNIAEQTQVQGQEKTQEQDKAQEQKQEQEKPKELEQTATTATPEIQAEQQKSVEQIKQNSPKAEIDNPLENQPLLDGKTNLTLQECIDITLTHNPSLASSLATQEAQKSRLSQSKSSYYPQINGSANYSRSNSNSSTGNSGTNNSYSSSINASQLIYDFGKTSSTINVQEKSYQTSIQNTNTLINDTIYKVKQAYFALLSIEKAREVYQQSVEQYTEQLKRAKAFYEVGTYPKIDVTSAQVNLNDAKLNLLTAENNVRTAKQTLLNIMGVYERNPNFNLANNNEVVPEFNLTLQDALKQARINRPDLLSQRLKVESAQQNITLAKTGYAPQISANGSYGWSGGDFPLYDRWSVGAGISVPIFSGLSTYNKVEEAKLNLQSEYYNLTSKEQAILLEVKTAFSDLNNAKERIPVAELTAQQAKESYDLAVGRYKVGVGNYIEVKDAETTYSKAKLSYIEAVFDYNLAIAKLKNAMGTR